MRIDAKEIASGKFDGQLIWICDFRFNNVMEKPIRHVRPMLVLVQPNTETTQRVYYSDSHFAKLNKNGTASKTIVKIYDATGYRAYTGIPLNAFDDKEECFDEYRKLAKIVIEQKEQAIIYLADGLSEDISKIHEDLKRLI